MEDDIQVSPGEIQPKENQPKENQPKETNQPASKFKKLLHSRLLWTILAIILMIQSYGLGIMSAFIPCNTGTICLGGFLIIIIMIVVSPLLLPIGLWLHHLNQNSEKNDFYEIFSWLLIIPGAFFSFALTLAHLSTFIFSPITSLPILLPLAGLDALTIYCLSKKPKNPTNKPNFLCYNKYKENT